MGWSTVVNFGGYAILAIILIMSLAGIAESQGGMESVINETVYNETYRNHLFWYEVSRDMMVPLYPLGEVPFLGMVYVPIDDWSPLFMIAITALVSFLVWRIFSPGWWMVPIIIVVFILVSWAWTAAWTANIYAHGSALGMTDEEITADLIGTSEIFSDNQVILPLGLAALLFVFWKGNRLIKR